MHNKISRSHHEAGHAVAAKVRFIPIKTVSIYPGDRSLGEVALSTGPSEDAMTLSDVVDRGIVAVAGAIAEARYNGSTLPPDDQDHTLVQNLLARWEPDSDCRTLLEEYIERKAIALVDTYWDGIVRVARRLTSDGSIGGFEVEFSLLGMD